MGCPGPTGGGLSSTNSSLMTGIFFGDDEMWTGEGFEGGGGRDDDMSSRVELIDEASVTDLERDLSRG